MTSGKVSSHSLWCISDAFSRFSERNNGQILKPGPDWEVYQLLEILETHPEVLSWGIWAPSMPSARDPRHQLGAGQEAPNGPGGPGTPEIWQQVGGLSCKVQAGTGCGARLPLVLFLLLSPEHPGATVTATSLAAKGPEHSLLSFHCGSHLSCP